MKPRHQQPRIAPADPKPTYAKTSKPPSLPPNIFKKPLRIPPMQNIKGDRPEWMDE